jgi:TetR/AcrR family fatty acid metabolism transcriptional regulator
MNEHSFRAMRIWGEKTKRNSILKKAAKVIAKKGFDNATIRDISRATGGISEGSFYNHFKNKDDILLTIFLDSWTFINGAIEDSIKDVSDPWRQFDAIIAIVLGFFKCNLDIAGVMVKETLSSKQRRQSKYELILSNWNAFIKRIDSIFAIAKKEKLIPEDMDIRILRQLLYGSVEMCIYGWFLSKKQGPYNKRYLINYDEEEVRRTIRRILEGLKEK